MEAEVASPYIQLLKEGLDAFRFTREYVDPTGELLPPIAGWSWFDWTQKVQALVGEPIQNRVLDERV